MGFDPIKEIKDEVDNVGDEISDAIPNELTGGAEALINPIPSATEAVAEGLQLAAGGSGPMADPPAGSGGWSGGVEEAPDYSEYYERMNDALDKQNELAQKQLDIAERQAQMAEAQFGFYKENFLPVIKDLIGQADRGIDADYTSAMAAQRTGAGMDAMAGAQERDLKRLGVDDTNPLYEGLDEQADEAKKFATSAAQNVARSEVVDTNQRRQMELAGMASGVPTLGTSALTASANTLAGAASTGMQAQQGVNTVQQAQLDANLRQTTLGNQAAYNEAQFRADASQANTMAEAQAMNSLFGGVGTLGSAYLYSSSTRAPSSSGSGYVLSSPSAPSTASVSGGSSYYPSLGGGVYDVPDMPNNPYETPPIARSGPN